MTQSTDQEKATERNVVRSELEAKLIEFESALTAEYVNLNGQWEHKIVTNPDPEAIALLGVAGWQMVGVTSFETGGGLSVNGIGGSTYKVSLQYVFKRKIPKVIGVEATSIQSEINRLTDRLKELGSHSDLVYQGKRDISDTAYQDFLMARFNISEVAWGKYQVGNETFASQSDALRFADSMLDIG